MIRVNKKNFVYEKKNHGFNNIMIRKHITRQTQRFNNRENRVRHSFFRFTLVKILLQKKSSMQNETFNDMQKSIEWGLKSRTSTAGFLKIRIGMVKDDSFRYHYML